MVSEGKVTEPQYLESFRKHCRNPLVEIRVHAPAGVPTTLVDSAKDLKQEADRAAERESDENLAYDEVWCVFDRDEHLKISEAREMARANDLRVAMSNPCFELWLLLHLRDQPGPQHRHKIQALLKDELPKVAPKHVDFDALVAGYDDAVRRATRLELEAREAGEPLRNPTTEVFHLTQSIDEGRLNRDPRKTREDESRAKAAAAAEAALAQAERESAEEADGDKQ